MADDTPNPEPLIVLLRSKQHYQYLLNLANKAELLDGDQLMFKAEVLYDLRQAVSVFTYNNAIATAYEKQLQDDAAQTVQPKQPPKITSGKKEASFPNL
jgi:hypothetical protein